MPDPTTALDERNATFWDELCGTSMARKLGITDASPESLRRFDEEYLSHYPYLQQYLDLPLAGAEVLEIGLGYGTLSGQLMARGASYHGLDIAEGPVEMARHRWRQAGGQDAERRVVRDLCSSCRSLMSASTSSTRSAACITPATCRALSRRFAACSGRAVRPS